MPTLSGINNSIPIRLLLVDDHPVVLEGLRAALGCYADLVIVGEAHDGPRAVEYQRSLQPDVTLVDLRLPGMDGIEVIHTILRESPHALFIVFSSYDTKWDILRARDAGAKAFLLKSTPPGTLHSVIRKVFSEQFVKEGFPTQETADSEESEALSPRELEVLSLVARGFRNQDIAKALDISLSTTKFHINNLLGKLNAYDRTEATMIAIRDGLIRVDSP